MMTDALGGFSSILVIPPFILTLYLNCPAFEYESNDLMVRIYFGALDLCPITEPHQGRLLLDVIATAPFDLMGEMARAPERTRGQRTDRTGPLRTVLFGRIP